MKIRLDEEMNSYMLVDENDKPIRMAKKEDWYKTVECTHIHALFGTPLCAYSRKRLAPCPICIEREKEECPFGYKKGRKILRTEVI